MKRALVRCVLAGVLAAVAIPTAAHADSPPRLIVSISQHCGWMPVSSTRMMWGDVVTVTVDDPNFRGPFWDWDGTEVVYWRYWLRTMPKPPAAAWTHADFQSTGWGGGGSVTLPTGVSEVSTSFLIRPGAGTPWLQVIGDLEFPDAHVIGPAYGTTQPAVLGC